MPRQQRGKKKRGGKGGSKNQKKQKKAKNEEEKENKEPDAGELLMKKSARRWEHDPNAMHEFWDGQPVPKMKEEIKDDGPIETKTVDEVRKTPYLLPDPFEWVDLDLSDDKEATEFYDLLKNHYVEDDDNMFRFNYSKEFLRWALLVPGYLKMWHLGVRVVKSGLLCGCITAIPATVQVLDKLSKRHVYT